MRGLFGLAPAADWRGRGERGCIGRVGVGLSCPAFPVRRRAHSFSPTTATTSTVSINIARSRDGLSPVGWLHSLLLLDSRPLLRPDMALVGVSWGCPMSHWSVRRKSKQTPCPAFSQVLSCHSQRLRHALRCCFQDGWASSMVWRSAMTVKLHIPGAGRTLQPCLHFHIGNSTPESKTFCPHLYRTTALLGVYQSKSTSGGIGTRN